MCFFRVKYRLKWLKSRFSSLFGEQTYRNIMVYAFRTGWLCKPHSYELWWGILNVLNNSRSKHSLRACAFRVKYRLKWLKSRFSSLFGDQTYHNIMVYAFQTGWLCKPPSYKWWWGILNVLNNSRSIHSLRACAFRVKYRLKWFKKVGFRHFSVIKHITISWCMLSERVGYANHLHMSCGEVYWMF